MATEFNLNDLIRHEITQANTPDPHVIAAKVANSIPAQHVKEAFLALLPHAVREQLRSYRHHTPETEAHETVGASGKKIRRSNKSKLVNDISGLGDDPFRWSEYIPEVKEWKWLGDCNRLDLKSIADGYYVKSDTSRRRGDQFTALADAVGEGTVRDLGHDGFYKVWGDK